MAYEHHVQIGPRPQRKRHVISRFLDKILVNENRIFEGSPCWEWQACKNAGGYGRLKGYKQNYAHRVSYVYFIDSIPAGYEVDHKCRNPSCVSPFHLQAVTHTRNMALTTNVKTHCIRGHLYDDANTGWTNEGARVCKACRYEAIKRWRKNHPDEARDVYRRDKAQYRAKGGIW